MRAQTETALGTLLAIMGGVAIGLLIYVLLSRLLNFPPRLALSLAVITAGIQYFVLRYWLLVGGGKGSRDDS